MSVTLKDVAEKLGVTITTVHKALNGKEGVSEKRRAEIMKVAAQMGYKVNYMASSLSKKKFHIAVVLPNTDGDNRFYYGETVLPEIAADCVLFYESYQKILAFF